MIYGDPVGFSSQEMFGGCLPLPVSASSPGLPWRSFIQIPACVNPALAWTSEIWCNQLSRSGPLGGRGTLKHILSIVFSGLPKLTWNGMMFWTNYEEYIKKKRKFSVKVKLTTTVIQALSWICELICELNRFQSHLWHHRVPLSPALTVEKKGEEIISLEHRWNLSITYCQNTRNIQEAKQLSIFRKFQGYVFLLPFFVFSRITDVSTSSQGG